MGAHQGDWEHITVRVLADGQTIHRVFYARHDSAEEGVWAAPSGTPGNDKEEFQVENLTHPVVYSAKHSHASYTSEGEHIRKWKGFDEGLPNDYTKKEPGNQLLIWRTESLLENIGEREYPRQGQEWIQYTGRWGRLQSDDALGIAPHGPYGPAFGNEFEWPPDPQVTKKDDTDKGGHIAPLVIPGPPQTAIAGMDRTFDAGAFGGSPAARVLIDWGDGAKSDFPSFPEGRINLPHTYHTGGQYCVAATVISPEGASASASFSISVETNHPPKVTAVGQPPRIFVGQVVRMSFDANDQDGDAVSYAAGHPQCSSDGAGVLVGTPSITNTGGWFECQFNTAGLYQPRLVLSDEHGRWSVVTYWNSTVEERPNVGIVKVAAGQAIAAGTATFRLTVNNSGPGPVTGALIVTDVLPPALTYKTASGSDWACSASGQTITCTYGGKLGPNASAPPIDLVTDAAEWAGPSITNTASVTTTHELDLADNSSTVTTSVMPAVLVPPNLVVAPGQSITLPVTLTSPAGPGGVTVSLASGNSQIAAVPAVFSIPAGAVTADRRAPVLTGVGLGQAIITAVVPGYAPAQQNVLVTITLSFAPPTLTAGVGRQTRSALLLSAPAPAGGLTIGLSSDNPAVASVPVSIAVPAGAVQVEAPVNAVGPGSTTVRASIPPFVAEALLNVVVEDPKP